MTFHEDALMDYKKEDDLTEFRKMFEEVKAR